MLERVITLSQLSPEFFELIATPNDYYHLGVYSECGWGDPSQWHIPKDVNKAFKYYQKAREGSGVLSTTYKNATYKLAQYFDDGIGTKKDEKKAAECYRIDAEDGNKMAQYFLGCLLLKNKETSDEGRNWLQKASQKGVIRAPLLLNGNVSFDSSYIHLACLNSKECYMPYVFPEVVNQNGTYCGSAALASAGRFSQHKNLFASNYELNCSERKEENPIVVLNCLQNTMYRTGGPQYNIHSFACVSEYIGLKDGKAVELGSSCTEEEYTNVICKTLRNNYVLILPSEFGDNLLPTQANGNKTHWVFAFGYWSDKENNYKLAVTHLGFYCEWPIHDLYQSNKQLPEENPRVSGGSLEKYRFTFFKIPYNKVPDIIMDGIIKKSAQDDSIKIPEALERVVSKMEF